MGWENMKNILFNRIRFLEECDIQHLLKTNNRGDNFVGRYQRNGEIVGDKNSKYRKNGNVGPIKKLKI